MSEEVIDPIIMEAEKRKERMVNEKYSGRSYDDLIDASEEEIKEKIHTTGNIKIGQFLIKIKNYKKDTKTTTINMAIYEERLNETYFGKNTIAKRVNIVKDLRFETCDWLKYFINPITSGINIPIETAAEIVRWLQGVVKLGAFL